ncbi:substrate-binding domain-containing protein [Acidiferrimicrobium sp. IK]|uniref:ABC transporter substrate-binding protein n=1 Tax=Acidiferrimicrobium sp. IK TaxID=2871700 RepID=UPI0021CB915C|nr:ABC transporter substrate-binding protein [Acidiferrimicrobium sp. IK]MCU4186713.1 substrate-binding domain-containing protein [Acidiferrimicrobium sp. IK]
MPRKLLAAASLASLAALAAAGCGSSSSNSSSTTAPAATSGSATTAPSTSAGSGGSGGSGLPAAPAAGSGKGKSLALIQGTKGDAFYITMACGAQAEAARLGAKINVQGPATFSASEQIPIVNAVTAAHPDAVLIAPTDSQALIAPMTQMKSAGIKLVEVDTTVKDSSLAVSSISSNNLEGGQLAAKTLAGLVGDKGSVVVINEQPGISTTDARAQGFDQEMKNYPGITVLPIQYDQDNANTAASLVSSVLAAHPDLSGIFAINTLTAQGVGTGLRQAGAQGRVKTVGFDAGPQQVQQLQAGVVQALIAQQPYQEGVTGVDEAVDALTGQPTQAQVGTNLVAITQSNLSQMQSYLYKGSC